MSALSSKERLIQFREYKEISNHAFEVMCGLANGYMSNKTTMPTTPILGRVHEKFPELNMNWLLFGEGTMTITDNSQNTHEDIPVNTELDSIKRQLQERTEALALVQSKYIALLEKMQDLQTPLQTNIA